MNSFLLSFFAICAIFLIDSSTGRRINEPRNVLNVNSEDSSLDLWPELIPTDSPKHPNAMCREITGDDEAIWEALEDRTETVETGREDLDFCSENISCIAANQGDMRFMMLETPPEGSQCKRSSSRHNFRFGCHKKECVFLTEVTE